MATCQHCGKEYSDEFSYCPYCAEPKRVVQTEVQELKQYKSKMLSKIIIFGIESFIVCALVFLYFRWLDGLTTAIILTTVIFIVFLSIGVLSYISLTKPGRNRTINMQFTKDQTSICPQCGSHSIKIYRNGYNYHTGFWGSIFGVRGSGYAGGFDANKTRCRCQNCGKDWLTDYDYRLL